MGVIKPASMAVIWFALFALCLADTTGAAGKTVVCYWQSWSHNMSSPHTYSADDIPVHLCTHVVYSYAKLVNRASSLYLGKVLDPGTDAYFRFLRLKERNPKVKLLLALGDRYGSDSAAWYEAIHDPPRRYHVVAMLYRLLKEHRFDGLHIDWENAVSSKGNGTDDAIVKFAWQIRKTFKRPAANFILSCATVLPKRRELSKFLHELVPYVDTFHVSPVGGSAGRIGSNNSMVSRSESDTLYTPLSNAAIRDGLQYLFEAGLPYEKMLLEIPFFGFRLPESSHHSESSNQGILPYDEVCDLLRQGVPTKWDEQLKSSYLVLDNGVRLYYDDADSVRQKVIFARWAGLGGVVAWPVNMDNQLNLHKRKNDLLKGIVEGMNEGISVELATQVAEASSTPPREPSGGISVISGNATQSSSVRESSEARSSAFESTTDGAGTKGDHTRINDIDLVSTETPSTVLRKRTPVDVEEATYGPTTSEPVFSPLTQTTAAPNFAWEDTSRGKEASTHHTSSDTMDPVTTEIPDSSSQNNTTTEVAEATNYNATDEFSPLTQTTAASNFGWEDTSRGKEASTQHRSSETTQPVTTAVPDSSSQINATTEVAESTNYNTTDEFSLLTQTTAGPNFAWEDTSRGNEASTHHTSSETMQPVTTAVTDSSSQNNTTTEVAESTNYNTTDEFSLLTQTTAGPNVAWEDTSRGKEASTHHTSSEIMQPVTTAVTDSASQNNTTTEVAEETNYNTTDEFSPLAQTTAAPSFSWEDTQRGNEASTPPKSSETTEAVTTEIPDTSVQNNTTTEVAEATNYNTTDEFSSLPQTTAGPNFAWEATSRGTEASIHHGSSETMEPLTTEMPESSSQNNTTTEVAEATTYNVTDEFSSLPQTTAAPNFAWEDTSRGKEASSTHHTSSDAMEPATTEIPDSSSEINTTTEVAEATNYNSTDEFSPLARRTAAPNYAWEDTSRRTEASIHHRSSATMEPLTTEMTASSSQINTTTEVAEATNYRTTDESVFSSLTPTTVNPNLEWELTSTVTEGSIDGRSTEYMEPVTTEVSDSLSSANTTTEVAEGDNERTTEDASFTTTPYIPLKVTPAGSTMSTETPIALQSVNSTELEQFSTASTPTESSNIPGFVTPSSTSFVFGPAENKCEKQTVGKVAHESDSEFYYHCYHGIALLRKCARGSKFSAVTGRCSVQSTDRHGASAVQASPISHHVVELLNKVVSGEVTLGKNENVGVDVNIKFNVGGGN